MEFISLSDYWEKLNRHDWYFLFSDDHSVYSAGARAADELIKLASLSDEHSRLYEGFRKHHFTGTPWNNEQLPKPEKP